ncbi:MULTISPECIES: hypothetical protein [unclassified Serratia (in: enterobacteria)]|uniref:hypothetical protein n=1 Tax=Serratia TaxID=613 RepID=UPI0021ADD0F2|nr:MULTISPECIES: hypothetical protein [unclassified Serratia (in: enterobacteria)]
MITTTIPEIMKVPKKYGTDICCSCLSVLAADECYICQHCNDEIDRQADEVIGNAEEGDE